MNISSLLKAALGAAALALVIGNPVCAETFNIPSGDLAGALDSYTKQTGVPVIIAGETLKGARTSGVHGDYSVESALTRILTGTGFDIRRRPSGAVVIVRGDAAANELLTVQMAANAAPTASGASLETVTVTSSKIGGDVQNIPISITALSQEQLTATQTAGGPDLVKQVPNMSFTKTNFSGYSIQLRGIGTQAISVTTDPAVAVAFNDTPFIRNHFFEQEFYDVSQVEVLRGPQGTLYGRNATAGVVNLVSAKPTDQFEALASADIGNYQSRRFEGMINVPIVDDRLDIRVAGEWTKRQGYSFNETTDDRIDGRDLWSSRVTIGWKPISDIQTYLVWEHFSEDDDRLRSGKQLCNTDLGPGEVNGISKPIGPGIGYGEPGDYFDQGCKPVSLYSPDAFEAPLGFVLPYVLGGEILGRLNPINPYAGVTQSSNLRVIESGLNPTYKAKNDVVEFNADYTLTPALTLTSQTGFGHDFLYSAEDYNRFGSVEGVFAITDPINGVTPAPDGYHICVAGGGDCSSFPLGSPCTTTEGGCAPAGYYCDPQLGCSDRLILEDLSQEHAWQLSQEFRLTTNFSGPFNFSAGGNFLHYETEENYYVFSNVFTMITRGSSGTGTRGGNCGNVPWVAGVSDNSDCLPFGFQFNDLNKSAQLSGGYIDPNPLSHLNDNGHNYFLSKNPYTLNSYAVFGEATYKILDDLKLTGGLRWTDDQKHFVDIPSWLVESGWGYPVAGVVDQQWDQFTGRVVANWSPKLDFTDQTLVYGSYAHGYKAGGANPPGAIFSSNIEFEGNSAFPVDPTHPLTFKPEFIDAFELGSKNTLLDGALTLNGDVFYYNYKAYQISEIVDRTAINSNFNATVHGAELETTWEPTPGLKFTFAGGYEATRIDNGQSAVDLMDRTAGHPGWFVVKPFVNEASNCIFPTYVAQWINSGGPEIGGNVLSYCGYAYLLHYDPFTRLPYVPNPTADADGFPPHTFGGQDLSNYPGYDPLAGTPGDPYTGQNKDPVTGIDYGPVPNNGTGFSKNLGGNKLPNAPPFTVSFGTQYTLPLSTDWAGTLRGDYYWQDYSWARVFNDNPYDRLRGYTNVNLTLIFTNQNGWQVMLYDKNVFNTTAITGDFLNSDDSGLTTNVFLTDPKLIGVRVTKNW